MSAFSQQDLEQALLQCESEPIHLIREIQPNGILLGLSANDHLTIVPASDNLHEFFDVYAKDALGQSLVFPQPNSAPPNYLSYPPPHSP